MKSDAELVTDDVGKLLSRLEKHTGERLLALETFADTPPEQTDAQDENADALQGEPERLQEAPLDRDEEPQ